MSREPALSPTGEASRISDSNSNFPPEVDMTAVRIRAKNQITLPASIVSQTGLTEDDVLDVACANGVITLVPRVRAAGRDDLMDYAGLAGTSYGRTARQIDAAIAKLRDEWTR